MFLAHKMWPVSLNTEFINVILGEKKENDRQNCKTQNLIKTGKNKHVLLMSQGLHNQTIRFIGWKMWPVASEQKI